MKYTEVIFGIQSEQEAEIIMAYLELLPFDSFTSSQKQLSAFSPNEKFNEEELKTILKENNLNCSYTINQHKDQNWNKTWEKNIDPIIIDDKCVIKTTFHNLEKTFPFEIIINPQMSFGTGHHQTTRLIIRQMFTLDVNGKTVLDMGCGTGVLGILAGLMNAKEVDLIDIDQWAVNNTEDNLKLNQEKIDGTVFALSKGGIEQVNGDKYYDLILSNITKNTNLENIESYTKVMNKGSQLIMSGFYEEDVLDITQYAAEFSLQQKEVMLEKNWASIRLEKL